MQALQQQSRCSGAATRRQASRAAPHAGVATQQPCRLAARPLVAGQHSRAPGSSRCVRLRVEVGKRAAAQAAAAAAAAAAPAGAGLLCPEAAFGACTYLMVPVYLLMAFWPRSKLSKVLLGSPLLPLAFAVAYAVLAWQAWHSGSLALVESVLRAARPLPDASLLAALFQDRTLAALAWLHLLMLDFLTARAVLLDGLRLLVPTAHSVLLCFMVGPLGLLSHLATRVIVHWRRRDSRATASSSMWS